MGYFRGNCDDDDDDDGDNSVDKKKFYHSRLFWIHSSIVLLNYSKWIYFLDHLLKPIPMDLEI
jgi:hypothetical protein